MQIFTWEIATVLLTVVALFVLFIRQSAPAEFLALGAVVFLMVFEIIGVDDVLAVFSNPAAMTVAAMFILSAALEKTGIIDYASKGVIGLSKTSGRLAIYMLLGGVFIASFFLNNTSVVMITIPVVISLAKHLRAPSSKFLIPLSYMSIMGGTCTLIGTSTNLLVDGSAQRLGVAPFGVFEILVPGVVLAGVGIVFMMMFGDRLLPSLKTLRDFYDVNLSRQFLAQMEIKKDSKLVGKTIAECGFIRPNGYEIIQHLKRYDEVMDGQPRRFNLRGLAKVLRAKMQMQPQEKKPDVDVNTLLEAGDKLVMLTNQRDVMNMEEDLSPLSGADIVMDDSIAMEGIIAPSSAFAGMRVADINNGASDYEVLIMAVHRTNDEIDQGKFDDVVLASADSVLMRGSEKELMKVFKNDEMVNLSRLQHEPYRRNHAVLALAVMLGVVLAAAFGIMPIAGAAFVGAIVVILTGCIKPDGVYTALQGSVLLLIYAMLAISVAMEKSGALDFVVEHMMHFVSTMPPVVVVAALYLVTSILTEFFSNNAAALMLTPVAVGLAHSMGADPKAFAVAVMFGASASFATPLGYQTNTLVYNAGGYRFKDFLKIGIPMNIVMWLTGTAVIYWYWGL